jgi:hypothetical protein
MFSGSAYPYWVDIEAMIARLGRWPDPGMAAVVERVLRERGGTIPDAQLIEEAKLAQSAWRQSQGYVSQETFKRKSAEYLGQQYLGQHWTTTPIDTDAAIFWCELAYAVIADKRRNGGSHGEHWACFHIRYAIRMAEERARFLPQSSPERIWLDLAREYAPSCALANTCHRPNYDLLSYRRTSSRNLGDQ